MSFYIYLERGFLLIICDWLILLGRVIGLVIDIAPDIRKIIRLKCLLSEILKRKHSAVFKQTCFNYDLLPKYSIYIYIYIYIYICIYIYIYIYICVCIFGPVKPVLGVIPSGQEVI